ncbi:MAG: cell wall metabolism sensor histidine kinase WalK [Chloroflexi bacterium]|nr:cell wall metabolism sensor histidine kinase WalK [Chloroflexota bacterium]MBU1746966.1 cell wall metabolism sensor histidine kinase WalK [Chloroflexota bacterium]
MSEQQTGRRSWFVSLRLKFLVGFTLLFSVVFAVAFYWFFSFASELAMNRIQDDMVDTLNGAIGGVNADEFAALAREGQPREDGLTDDPRYWRHLDWLEMVHNIEPRANPYTYVLGEEPNEVLFIGDILVITNPEKAAAFRESYVSKGGMWGGLTGLNLKMEPYDDQWGSWVSAYAPIRNAAGEVVGAMGLDFKADYVRQVQQAILDKVLVAFAITYVILFVFVFLISGALTRPTLALTQAAEQVAQGDYAQDIQGLYSGRMRDEISSLAQVFDLMIDKVREREESLKRQVQELRIEIDEVKKAKQVAEITDTDYFRDLRDRAKTLRKTRRSQAEEE